MSPEEMAAQVEQDIAAFQRLSASRGTSDAARRPAVTPASDATTAMGGGQAMLETPVSSASSRPVTAAGSEAASIAPTNAVEGPLATPAPPALGVERGAGPRRVPETPEALASAAAALYRDATRADTPLRSLMAIAALSIADPDRPFNAEAMPDLTEQERRSLAQFHAFCRDLGRQLASSDDPEAVSRAVEQLSRDIRGERRLRVPRSEICTQVEGFGVFSRIEPCEFIAHSGARFVLYCEVDGYRSSETGSAGWKTDLSIELSILSERDGVPVWRRDWQTVTDLSATQRKDFFVTFRITLPDALSVGAYTMKVRVRDEQNGALAERSVPFRMVAAPSPRGGTDGSGAATDAGAVGAGPPPPPPSRSTPRSSEPR